MAVLTKIATGAAVAAGAPFNGSWTDEQLARVATTDETAGGSNTYATAAPGKNQEFASLWPFVFSEITAGSTINSVSVKVQWKFSTTASIATLTSSCFADDGAGAPDQATALSAVPGVTSATPEPTVDTDQSYAATCTAAQLIQGIWVRAQAQRGNSNTAVTASLDYIQVTVDYTAATSTDYPASGTLGAQSSTAAGTAVAARAGVGALTAQAASVAGASAINLPATGALQAQPSEVEGVGAAEGVYETETGDVYTTEGATPEPYELEGTAATVDLLVSGALQVQQPAISGSAASGPSATGGLDSQPASIGGALGINFAAAGALASQPAAVASAANAGLSAAGALQAQAAAISGAAVVPSVDFQVTGSLQAGASSVDGVGAADEVYQTETGEAWTTEGATPEPYELEGTAATVDLLVSGTLQAQPASVAGAVPIGTDFAAAGALFAQDADVSGETTVAVSAAGALQAQSAAVVATVRAGISAAGALLAQPAAISGTLAADQQAIPIDTHDGGGEAEPGRYTEGYRRTWRKDRSIRRKIEELYERAENPQVLEEASEVLAPFIDRSLLEDLARANAPMPVMWDALLADAAAVRALLRLYQRQAAALAAEQAREEEEIEILLLL